MAIPIPFLHRKSSNKAQFLDQHSILNNCSLDDVCKEGKGYQNGTVELKPLEFVDDIADPNKNKYDAQISNKVITGVQELKKLKFSSEKCKVLKINSSSNRDTLFIEDRAFDIVRLISEMCLMTREITLHSAKIGQIRQLAQLLNFSPFVSR